MIAQRWRDGRGVYVPAGEVIDPSRYDVAFIDELPGKPCAIGGSVARFSEPVVVTQEGDNQNGELLFYIEQSTGMTAAELRAFAVWLASEYRD